jgi:hypothetical protein
VQPDSEDEAWRSIVENYGDRADVDPSEAPIVPAPDDAEPAGEPEPVWEEERFVPPPPPPLPRVAPDRMLAWSGLFGSPTVLLTALVLGFHLPGWLAYLLVAWFVGGFVYLVVQMPSGPRDPGDDGARL